MVNAKKSDEKNQLKFESVASQYISNGERSMWLMNKLKPLSSAYNLVQVASVKENIDIGLLKKTLIYLVKHHIILGSKYMDMCGKLVKNIYTRDFSNNFYLEEKNMQGLSEQKMKEYIQKKCNEPFDLGAGPLLRVHVIKKGQNESVFLMVIHHIVADYLSLEILMKEIGETYSAIKNNRDCQLLPNSKKFSMFAEKENSFRKGADFENQKQYWINQLSGEIPLLNMHTDKSRSGTITSDGRTERFIIGKGLAKKIKQLAKNYNETPYRLFMAAYYILLSRYSGQNDIIIGSPVSLRKKDKEFQDEIGYFVNILPFRFNYNDNLKFSELISKVSDVISQGIENRKYPFSSMVSELQIVRDFTRSPIFQVSFTMQQVNDKSMEGLNRLYLGGEGTKIKSGDLEFHSIDFNHCSSQYEISLFIEEIGEEYCGWFMYQTDLFHEATIKQFSNHFVNIIEELGEDTNKKINDFQVISKQEKENLLHVINNIDFSYSKECCIHEIIEKKVDEAPDSIALAFGESTLSYLELNQKANQVAHFLRQKGISAGMMVPICLEPSLEMIIGIVGILKAGGTYVPFNPVYPKDRTDWMLEEINPKLIISESKFNDRFSEWPAYLLNLDKDWGKLEKQSVSNLDNIVAPDQTAYIIYTSGSTGKPKGVMVSHYNVLRLFKATNAWYKFDKEDVWTLFHSFAFDFSVWEIFGALIYGGKLVIVPYFTARSPEDFYKLLEKEQVTVLNQTPSAFRQLIRVDEKMHEMHKLSLRYVIFGGEALELKTLAPWMERHGDRMPKLINMYGITETTVHVTYRPITYEDVKNGLGSVIGVPIPDLQVYILDENKNIVPTGCSGEIYVGGAGVAKGYFNRDGLTKDRFNDDFITGLNGRKLYRSGDLARYLHNGEIEYMGRIDNQVKIRGFRIELGDIESKILEFPDVRDAIVLTKENNVHEKKLVAYVVMHPNKSLSIEALRSYLKEKLPDYMIPFAFFKLDTIPLTPNGKIDKNALPDIDKVRIDNERGSVLPRTSLEKEIAETWKEVLSIENIDIDKNFFDVGGDSMTIVTLHSIIRDKIYNQIEVVNLFQYPTIKLLSNYIESKNNANIKRNEIMDRSVLRKQARTKKIMNIG